MIYLRNIAFAIAFYIGSVVIAVSAVLAFHLLPSRFRKACDAWSRWHHWCCVHLLGLEFQETGQRPDGPALYAIKHEAFYEAIALPFFFDNPAVFAKQELFDIPFWGKAGYEYGLIPVRRDEGSKALRAMIRDVKPMIEAGRPITIFPEGTRTPHNEQPELQAGLAALYKLLRLPVVPVAIDSGPFYQRKWKKGGTITLHFGEAIEPGLSREEFEALVHKGMNWLNDSAVEVHPNAPLQDETAQ